MTVDLVANLLRNRYVADSIIDTEAVHLDWRTNWTLNSSAQTPRPVTGQTVVSSVNVSWNETPFKWGGYVRIYLQGTALQGGINHLQ
jgi:hypothetical protein